MLCFASYFFQGVKAERRELADTPKDAKRETTALDFAKTIPKLLGWLADEINLLRSPDLSDLVSAEASEEWNGTGRDERKRSHLFERGWEPRALPPLRFDIGDVPSSVPDLRAVLKTQRN
jgi:hypothetical protein